jgi:hypothetical protein
MTDSQQLEEWVRCFKQQMTDEAKLALFAHLKKESRTDKVAREALIKTIALWVEE